jgi:hypothetical protein
MVILENFLGMKNNHQMTKKYSFALQTMLLLSFVGCMMKRDKLYFKIIETPTMRLEWYVHSTISAVSLEYVVVSTDSGQDTLAEVNVLHDVQVDAHGKIHLLFYGEPRLYENVIAIPNTIFNIPVVVDQTISFNDQKPWKTFKEERW